MATAVTIGTANMGATHCVQNVELQDGRLTYPFDLKTIPLSLNATTTGSGSTFTVNLWEYGITRLLAIKGWIHSTSNSVVVAENPTCTVNNGVATITIGGAAVTLGKRYFELYGI